MLMPFPHVRCPFPEPFNSLIAQNFGPNGSIRVTKPEIVVFTLGNFNRCTSEKIKFNKWRVRRRGFTSSYQCNAMLHLWNNASKLKNRNFYDKLALSFVRLNWIWLLDSIPHCATVLLFPLLDGWDLWNSGWYKLDTAYDNKEEWHRSTYVPCISDYRLVWQWIKFYITVFFNLLELTHIQHFKAGHCPTIAMGGIPDCALALYL